ncbi:MAG TPA: hypothetical protein VLE96_01760 [Chlamydiales bacterium]|nr:hypothetical protein [Chlamydiales bacterium]
MSVEGCSLQFDEDRYNVSDFRVDRNWNGHMIDVSGNSVAHLVKGYSKEGWGGIKNQIKPMKGSAGGSIEAKGDSDDESSVTAEVHVTVKDDDGNKITFTAEGSVKNDGDGNTSAGGGVKLSVEKDF